MNQGTEWGLLMKNNRSQKSRAGVPLMAQLNNIRKQKEFCAFKGTVSQDF
jgi:hypothetical protein